MPQCKITKLDSASGKRLDGISVESVVQDSRIISHWVFSSPASIEIVAEPVDSGALTNIGDLTLRHWLLKWLFYLQSEACGSLASVLKLVVAAQEFDMPSMMCLFPYLLHNVITEGKPEAQDVIVKGLLAVVQVYCYDPRSSLRSVPRALDTVFPIRSLFYDQFLCPISGYQ